MAVNESLEVSLCAQGLKVPIEKVSHLTGLESKVELCSQVLNMLFFLKTYS
ncbi:Hypothetical protein FKW44_009013 [Caligus rogercresseyi]|uniref:Uncharacterized protein n=1 Tax=Caligus rogercresseyi TaxID=217165 RepID=A0A7T8K765_CALRO|nr:Hypothetical protein FKW44_009013 [Caligus rogercresseyi]